MENLSDLIPQVFYDLIARIFPGLILILSTMLVINCPAKFEELPGIMWDPKPINFANSVIIVIEAYILSLFVYLLFRRLIHTISPKHGKEILKRDNSHLISDIKIASKSIKSQIYSGNINFPHHYFMYDYIRLIKPEVGARLVKLRAEYHLGAILSVGWLLIFILHIYRNYILIGFNSANIFVGIGLIVCMTGAYLFMKDQHKRYIASLESHWVIIKSGVDGYIKFGQNENILKE